MRRRDQCMRAARRSGQNVTIGTSIALRGAPWTIESRGAATLGFAWLSHGHLPHRVP
jgi:hypothetical protein